MLRKNKVSRVESIMPGGRNAFTLDLVSENLRHLIGEVLTVIDASTEGEKNKAIKDLIKDKFEKKFSWFSELSWKELDRVEKFESKDIESRKIALELNNPREEWEGGLVPFNNLDLYYFKD